MDTKRKPQHGTCPQCTTHSIIPLCGHSTNMHRDRNRFHRTDYPHSGAAAPLCQKHCNDRHSNLGGWAKRRWRHEVDVEERMRNLEFGEANK